MERGRDRWGLLILIWLVTFRQLQPLHVLQDALPYQNRVGGEMCSQKGKGFS